VSYVSTTNLEHIGEFEKALKAGAFRDFESFRKYSEQQLIDKLSNIEDKPKEKEVLHSVIEDLIRSNNDNESRIYQLIQEVNKLNKQVHALLIELDRASFNSSNIPDWNS